MAALIADVLASPAVAILCALERDGFQVELLDGVLSIAPQSRLTPERMQAIVTWKEALRALLQIRDDGVVERRDLFRQQLEATPAPGVPAFLLRPVPYELGQCFACGEPLHEARYGRCWRCSIAWRLACRLPIAVDVAEPLDHRNVSAPMGCAQRDEKEDE